MSVVAILKGYVEFVIYRIFDVILQLDASYFRPYAETKNNGGEQKICIKWIQFRSCFRPCGAEVSRFIIQKISHCFSLSFNVSVDMVPMFLSCFMIMIFSRFLKS